MGGADADHDDPRRGAVRHDRGHHAAGHRAAAATTGSATTWTGAVPDDPIPGGRRPVTLQLFLLLAAALFASACTARCPSSRS